MRPDRGASADRGVRAPAARSGARGRGRRARPCARSPRSPERAARYRERFLELGGSSAEEVAVALAVAQFHAARGEVNVARAYLARATALDPRNPAVARLSASLAH
jgi:uncharacterized protein HemY